MDLSLQSVKTNNCSADNFRKTCHLNDMYTWQLGLRYSQLKLVRWYPFWQLSIDYKMDVHKDVHYWVKYMQIVYALDT